MIKNAEILRTKWRFFLLSLSKSCPSPLNFSVYLFSCYLSFGYPSLLRGLINVSCFSFPYI